MFTIKRTNFLHGLAPREVYRDGAIYIALGGLLHRLFTLTDILQYWRFIFCDTALSAMCFHRSDYSLLPDLENLDRHAALRSSDFPHSLQVTNAIIRWRTILISKIMLQKILPRLLQPQALERHQFLYRLPRQR